MLACVRTCRSPRRAGIAGSLYTSRYGRLPPFFLTAGAAVVMAAVVGAVFSGSRAQAGSMPRNSHFSLPSRSDSCFHG